MSERLQEIRLKNVEFEKESPYNFCDRWCERCVHDKQIRCKLYQDEFEQKITCIAYGREPYDPEITEEVMRRQFENIEEKIEQFMEENEIDMEDIDDQEFEEFKEHIEFAENNPLQKTAEQYYKKTHAFLENAFHKKAVNPELTYDFETVVWYHTLLPVKLNRVLAGFHESGCGDDLSLYDAVAQLEICQKAITESIKALRKIDKSITFCHKQILLLLALLHNIYDRIKAMENSI